MHEGYRPYLFDRISVAALGYVLLAGCGTAPTPQHESIDCIAHPGDSISVVVDSTIISEGYTLKVKGADTFTIGVAKAVMGDTGEPAPNQVLGSPDSSPIGFGGSEEEIDKEGADGYVAFSREPQPGDVTPPYYKLTVLGDPHSHNVTFELTCDQDQTAR